MKVHYLQALGTFAGLSACGRWLSSYDTTLTIKDVTCVACKRTFIYQVTIKAVRSQGAVPVLP